MAKKKRKKTASKSVKKAAKKTAKKKAKKATLDDHPVGHLFEGLLGELDDAPSLLVPEEESPVAEAAKKLTPGMKLVKSAKPKARKNAQSMAADLKEASVAEFFHKNLHLLGFDNPRKALLTGIKEAVDNSLDACEEAGILPDLYVEIKPTDRDDRFVMIVEDNGPGIVRAQIGRIFGKLLYGSKFHRLKMSRGQQGIGISAAGMYGQITTTTPVKIISRTSEDVPAHAMELHIDTRKNEPTITKDEEIDWDKPHGTRVEIMMVAKYQKGRQSIDEFLEETAIACPHISITYKNPLGEVKEMKRGTDVLPEEPREIKPHPHGVEQGLLMKMINESRDRTLTGFLHNAFCRVSSAVGKKICKEAGVRPSSKPSRMNGAEIQQVYDAINKTKLMAPPTNCLSPIGEEQIIAGLKTQINSEFYAAVSRSPAVYRGNPFLVEAGIAYGGDQDQEGLVRLLRYANRVPLLYQQGAGAIYQGVVDTAWRNYRVPQSRGALPAGPMTIMVHFASAWVPFTSESKEAIASYPEIQKEIRLALQECGRRLATHLRKKRKAADAERKMNYIEKFVPHIGIGLRDILGFSEAEEKKLVEGLQDMLTRARK